MFKYNNNCDDIVDEEIKACLDLKNPNSFFIQAGAGSGKTKSLVDSINYIDEKYGEYLYYNYKKIAVITYTNAACDEIKSRIKRIRNFKINTIHSFLWDLIKDHQEDIRTWMLCNIIKDLKDVENKEAKGKTGTVASTDRLYKIKIYKEKIIEIPHITKFIYNPLGLNFEKESLTHSDVIKMGSMLINENTTLQKILIDSYPIILIDESQDTKKELVDALLNISNLYKDKIIIGMFGDTMQRIYLDGKDNLVSFIPTNWKTPVKKMNHRSSKRIIDLANIIRSDIDNIEQLPRTDAKKGIVKFFLVNINNNKPVIKIEQEISKKMCTYTGDLTWLEKDGYQKLMLEHHMVAKRMNFDDFFYPLYNDKKFKSQLVDGSLPEYKFFDKVVIPFIKALEEPNKYEIMKILRANSPIFSKNGFNLSGEDYGEILNNANKSINNLSNQLDGFTDKSCLFILKKIDELNLFNLTIDLQSVIKYNTLDEIEDESLRSLFNSLSCPISSIKKYSDYINKRTSYATHQGVKGLEFTNVMVIMSDEESKGFLFKYEKLFGVVDKTSTDIRNEDEGNDSSITRTIRLFYVTCTRAKENLALVMYTDNTEKAKNKIKEKKWANKNDIDLSFA